MFLPAASLSVLQCPGAVNSVVELISFQLYQKKLLLYQQTCTSLGQAVYDGERLGMLLAALGYDKTQTHLPNRISIKKRSMFFS